jgi:hypothetical protein
MVDVKFKKFRDPGGIIPADANSSHMSTRDRCLQQFAVAQGDDLIIKPDVI